MREKNGKRVTGAMAAMLILLAGGCNRGLSDGLRSGLEQGVVTGVSSLIAAVFSTIGDAVFGAEAAANNAGEWPGG